jgi:hypothetical protein
LQESETIFFEALYGPFVGTMARFSWAKTQKLKKKSIVA